MSEAELDEILTLRWPALVRRVMADMTADSFVRGFVRSIARHGKRQSWRPTAKQAHIMRQLLDEFSGQRDDDFDPIERS